MEDFKNTVFKVVRGVGKKVEVGANFFYKRKGKKNSLEFQPNVKWKAYENEKEKVAVSGGAVMFVPLNKAAGSYTNGLVYTNVSKKFSKLKGLRLTGGGYSFIGNKKSSKTRMGVMAGLDIPITKKVYFVSDWASGKNRIGYGAAGMKVKIGKRQAFYIGYKFGNTGRGNNALAAHYGLNF